MTQSQALMLPACRRKSHGGDAQSVTDPPATRVTAPAADDQPPADKSDTATSSVRPQQQRKAPSEWWASAANATQAQRPISLPTSVSRSSAGGGSSAASAVA